MSDTISALIITVLLLAALAAWVPLLHMAERVAARIAQPAKRKLPGSRERTPEGSFGAGIAH